MAAATIRAHCLIAAKAAGPPLIPSPQARALSVPPPIWGPWLLPISMKECDRYSCCMKQSDRYSLKVFYGQEPLSGESTTTECGVNYQLLAVITEVAQWGANSCSQPQPATDNGVRDGRSN